MNLARIRRKPVVTFIEALYIFAAGIPAMRAHLERNRQLRKHKHKDMEGIGRLALSIPEAAEVLLEQYHPELYQDDKQLAAKAMLQFMHSSDAEPFRVAAKI